MSCHDGSKLELFLALARDVGGSNCKSHAQIVQTSLPAPLPPLSSICSHSIERATANLFPLSHYTRSTHSTPPCSHHLTLLHFPLSVSPFIITSSHGFPCLLSCPIFLLSFSFNPQGLKFGPFPMAFCYLMTIIDP